MMYAEDPMGSHGIAMGVVTPWVVKNWEKSHDDVS